MFLLSEFEPFEAVSTAVFFWVSTRYTMTSHFLFERRFTQEEGYAREGIPLDSSEGVHAQKKKEINIIKCTNYLIN